MTGQPYITTQPIRIAQLNIQKKKQATIQLLNNFKDNFDIFLIQEPAWGFIGRDSNSGKEIHGPVVLQGWSTILPLSTFDATSPRPRTLTYFKSCPDFSVTMRSDLIEDRDIQFLNICQPGHPTISVLNIYNDPTRGEDCILNKICLNNNILPTHHPTLLTGDYNLHHPKWSRDDRLTVPDQLTSNIVDWLAQSNHSMLNQKGEITHLARHDGERSSVIDL